MAFETWTPPRMPQLGSSLQLEERVKEAAFGDGFTQIAQDGINAQTEAWTLIWNACPNADRLAIEAFWRSKGRAIPFYFKVPGEPAPKQFRFASGVQRNQLSGSLDSIQIQIKQSFEIEE